MIRLHLHCKAVCNLVCSILQRQSKCCYWYIDTLVQRNEGTNSLLELHIRKHYSNSIIKDIDIFLWQYSNLQPHSTPQDHIPPHTKAHNHPTFYTRTKNNKYQFSCKSYFNTVESDDRATDINIDPSTSQQSCLAGDILQF